MEGAVRKNLIITESLIVIISVLTCLGLYFFNPSLKTLPGLILLSILLCLGISVLLFKQLERFAEHPIYSWVLLSAYLIIGIMMCFPNYYVTKLALYFIIIVPVAAFIGNSFAFVFIIYIFLMITMMYGINTGLILQTVFVIITGIQVSLEIDEAELVRHTSISTTLQFILLFLYHSLVPDKTFFNFCCINIVLLGLASVFSILARLKDVFLWEVFDYDTLAEEESKPEVEETISLDRDTEVTEYTLAELCSPENTYYRALVQKYPKTAAREYRAAMLAKHVSGLVGADAEYVYCLVLYRAMIKFCPQNVNTSDFISELKLPEKLKNSINKMTKAACRPSDFEEIIAYTAFEIFRSYYYFKKENADVSIQKITDSVCMLLLKKGIVRDCLLPMSLFHKMKQGFMEHVAEYVRE